MRSARTMALAGALALAGCGQGSSHPDPDPGSLDADGDFYVASRDCDDHDARVYYSAAAFRDLDGDGVGGAAGTACAGMGYLPAGWSYSGGDCDDQDPAVFASARLFADADGDGVGADPAELRCIGGATPPGWAATGGDCAPADGSAWRPLAYTARDADGDGVAVPAQGERCVGTAGLPPGYLASGTPEVDCDDGDPSRTTLWSGFEDGDGDGVGAGDAAVSVCAGPVRPGSLASAGGDCAPADPAAWQMLTYLHVDADRDGASVPGYGQLCAGAQLPPGYLSVASGDDCDDADPSRAAWRWLFADGDGDGRGAGVAEQVCTGGGVPPGWAEHGEDCAPADATRWRTFPYTARDADGDTRTVAEAGTLCLDDGPPPAGYGTAAVGDDCDDANPAVWARVTGFLDADADGFGVSPAIVSCTAGTLPSGQVASAGDCAPDDAERWQVLSYGWVDRDGDGVTALDAGQVCAGRFLPEPYRAVASGADCDDARADRWRWAVRYPDGDGDGVGAPPREVPCLGTLTPAGSSARGWDPDDADPAVSAPRPTAAQAVF